MPLGLTDVQIIAFAGFLISGFVIPILKRAAWPNYVNALIALVTYAVTAGIVTLVQGVTFTATAYVQNFLVVFGSGTIGYAALWGSTIDEFITTRINAGTPPPAA